jgi:cholesterol oxidase
MREFWGRPTWHELLGRKPVTGHPLCGCPLADDARDGVVNHRGQVFSEDAGDQVHPGLFVMDGSIVPVALGVNPLLRSRRWRNGGLS